MPATMMMPDWEGLAAMISAMIDVVRLGRDTYAEFVSERREDPELGPKAKGLAAALGTYSQDEVAAIIERIDECRQRFMAEGSGAARTRCICSVLRDVRDGNGGTLPHEDWEAAWDQLGCAAA